MKTPGEALYKSVVPNGFYWLLSREIRMEFERRAQAVLDFAFERSREKTR